MSSLSLDAGSPNPNNFYRGEGAHSRQGFLTLTVNGGSPSILSNPNLIVGYDREHFNGRVLTDFHRRKNDGELLPMTHFLSYSQTHTGTGERHFTYNWNSNVAEYVYSVVNGPVLWTHQGGVTLGEVSAAEADIAANLKIDPMVFVQRAVSKLYTRGWDAGTFLAELHRVRKMFRTALRGVVDILSRDPVYLFNAWLAGRYGWRILCYDIMDIQNVIANLDKAQKKRNKERVGDDFTWTNNFDTSFSTPTNVGTVYDSQIVNLGIRGSVIADFVPPKFYFDPISTTWEIFHYSFVIDWFITVGKALDAMSFLAVTDQYTASVGLFYEAVRTLHLDGSYLDDTAPPWGTRTGVLKQDSIETISYKRRIPKAVSTTPLLNVRLDAFKILDLVAILGQLASRVAYRGHPGVTRFLKP